MELKDVQLPLYLFVYGTLKYNMSNNHFLKGCEYICDHKVLGYGLYSNGYYPVMYPDAKLKRPVEGEIWRIDNMETMSQIFRLESGYDLIEIGYKTITIGRDFYGQHPFYGFVRSKERMKAAAIKAVFWKRYMKSNWSPTSDY